MEQPNFSSGVDRAIKDAYLAMSRAVGKQIKSAYKKESYRGPKGSYEELTCKIIIKTLNYVRGEELCEKYWRKLKNDSYEVCVLFKISKAQYAINIAESVCSRDRTLKERDRCS